MFYPYKFFNNMVIYFLNDSKNEESNIKLNKKESVKQSHK
jgi:hypothetical protein